MTTFRTGNGAAWLDLLSSLGGRYRATQHDDIAEPTRLGAWLAQAGLAPLAAPTPADVRSAQTLREALHAVTIAVMHASTPTPADVATLDQALAADRPLRLGDDARPAPPADAGEALARLARDAVQALAGPELEQLHECGDETCSGVFRDGTGRRRWCSDERCGNRVRVAAHRARARKQAGS